MSTPLSIRFPDDVAERVRSQVATTSEPTSGLVVRLVDEGMRMAEHPGITFRDGPTGRRAGLAGGPDVWEIIAVLRDYATDNGKNAIRRTAEHLAISEVQVRVAESYFVAYPDEVNARVDLNLDAATLAGDAARRRADLRA
ncbi:MAG: hypothetical protein JJE46_08290 [Acidimicrobiia bacterium]|nr:hypothetical protein [Acidimicrobiia bacterium]